MPRVAAAHGTPVPPLDQILVGPLQAPPPLQLIPSYSTHQIATQVSQDSNKQWGRRAQCPCLCRPHQCSLRAPGQGAFQLFQQASPYCI